MASTRRISIDIYVYTCIRARARALFAERGVTRMERLSTGSYFPVRQHGCRLSLVIAVPRATACVLPTRITPSSLARLSHFKHPLSLSPPPPSPAPCSFSSSSSSITSLPFLTLRSLFLCFFLLLLLFFSCSSAPVCALCARLFTPLARLCPTSCSLSMRDEVKRDANGFGDN